MEDKIVKIKVVLLVVIGLAYVIMGGVVIVKHWFLVNIEANTSYILGAILILYGLFRIYRAIINIQKGSL
jgi:hypothetical protein